MSINITGYATCWGEPEKDQYDNVVMSITSTHKNKKTDEWIKDYSDKFTKFSGECAKKALKLKDRDRIYIERGTVGSGWDKDKQKAWMRTTVWDFKMADEMNNESGKKAQVDDPYDGDIDEDSMLPV